MARDRLPDILVGDGGANFSSQVAVFVGDGHGHFSQKPLTGGSMGDFGGPAVLGDFNRDGNLDMVYFGEAEGNAALFIVLGNGDGTFQNATNHLSIQNVGVPAVAAGDFNGDGKLDLAVGSSEFTEAFAPIQIFLGNGDGTFTAATLYAATENSIAAADLNGDGKLDLVFNGTDENNVPGLCVMSGHGDGTFASTVCGNPAGVAQLADFNGDGKLDVAGPGTISLGNGDGTFQSPISLPFAGTNGGFNFGVADFSGDGELDFVLPSTTTGGPVTVLLQTTLGVSTASLNFGQHPVGSTSKPQTITFTNIDTSPLSLGSITLTGVDPGDYIEHPSCGRGIMPGASCSVQVAFKPTADGSRTASLTVTYLGVGSPQNVVLTGTGIH